MTVCFVCMIYGRIYNINEFCCCILGKIVRIEEPKDLGIVIIAHFFHSGHQNKTKTMTLKKKKINKKKFSEKKKIVFHSLQPFSQHSTSFMTKEYLFPLLKRSTEC